MLKEGNPATSCTESKSQKEREKRGLEPRISAAVLADTVITNSRDLQLKALEACAACAS